MIYEGFLFSLRLFSSSALPGMSSRGRQWFPVTPVECFLLRHRKNGAAASHIPAFALSSSPSSLSKGSTTPCQPIRAWLHLLHHIISVSKVTGHPAHSLFSLSLRFHTERCRIIIIIIPPTRPSHRPILRAGG